MALNPDPHWYPLVVTAQLPVCSPPLLIQRSFTNNTYSIYLTDLTYIWGEALSRREIVQRALNEDTSIDPSEDVSQMRILLEKLKEALSLCSGEDDNNSIDVDIQAVPSKSSTSTGTVIQLKVTYALPKPLEPLLWTFKLQPLPQAWLTKTLLLPLISLTSLYSTEVQALVRVIKDKDIVLEKMQDSLEDSKISVTSILGGGASRRRGLEKFDEKKWRSRILESEAGDISRPEKIVKSFFRVERGRSASDEGFGQEWEEVVSRIEDNVNNTENEKDWWDEIEAAPRSRQKKRRSMGFESDESVSDPPVRKVSSKSDASRGTRETSSKNSSQIGVGKARIKGRKVPGPLSSDEDEFQVQGTPPRSKSASKVKSPPPARKVPLSRRAQPPKMGVDESTTEEDDDLDISPPKSPPRARRAKSPTPALASSPPPYQPAKSPTPPSPLPPLRELSFSTGSRTVSRKPSKPLSGTSTPTPSPPPLQARPRAKIGGRIGTVGGKKAVGRESPQPRSPYPEIPRDTDRDEEKTSDEEQTDLVKSSAPLGKIGGRIGGKIGGKVAGIIGGKKTAVSSGEDTKDCEAARMVDLPARGVTPQKSRANPRADADREVPPKREAPHDPMDEEAADRKRRQLQQELEAKQKVPAKKKRKF